MEDMIKTEMEGFASALFGIDICIVYEAKAIDSGIGGIDRLRHSNQRG